MKSLEIAVKANDCTNDHIEQLHNDGWELVSNGVKEGDEWYYIFAKSI